MKIKVDTKKFRSVVENVIQAVETKAELETFKGIQVTIDEFGTLTMIGVAPGFIIKDSVEGEPLESGKAAFGTSAIKLSAVAEVLNSPTTTISFTDTLVVQNGRSRFTIPVFKDTVGVPYDEPKQLTAFNVASLCAVLKQQSFSPLRDDAIFCSYQITPERIWSTNRVNMAVSKNTYLPVTAAFPLHVATAARLHKVFSSFQDALFGYVENNVLFISVGNTKAWVKPVAVAAHRIDGILNVPRPWSVKFDTKELISELSKISVSADAKSPNVTMTFANGICSMVASDNKGEATGEVPCSFEQNFGPIKLGLVYFLPALNSIKGGSVTIRAVDPKKPILLEGEDILVVVNPVSF